MKVHREARLVFDGFLKVGLKHVNGHMLAIMSLLGPLRRCCSGGELRERVCCLISMFCAKLKAACNFIKTQQIHLPVLFNGTASCLDWT